MELQRSIGQILFGTEDVSLQPAPTPFPGRE